MQFVCNPEHISPRLKYTIDFIFTTLGFNVTIVSNKEIKNSNELVIGYLRNEDLQLYKKINLINIANFDQLNPHKNDQQLKMETSVPLLPPEICTTSPPGKMIQTSFIANPRGFAILISN